MSIKQLSLLRLNRQLAERLRQQIFYSALDSDDKLPTERIHVKVCGSRRNAVRDASPENGR